MKSKKEKGAIVAEGEKEDMDKDGDVDSDDWKMKRDHAIKKAKGEDDKEDVNEGEDLSTADSEQETEKSPANHTSASQKKSGKDLVTADSELNASDSLANHTNPEPKKTGQSLAVADSELDPSASLANQTKTNLPDVIGEGEEAVSNQKEEQKESEPFDDKENPGDEKGDIVTEEEKDEPFDEKTDIPADENDEDQPFVDVNESLNEVGDDGEEELDQAAQAVQNLDIAPVEEPAPEGPPEGELAPEMGDVPPPVDAAPEAPVEEPPVDLEGGEAPAEEPVDLEGGEDVGDEAGEGEDEKSQIKKKIGEIQHLLTQVDLADGETKEDFNQILAAFLPHLADLEIEDKKEMSDKIKKAQPTDVPGEEEVVDTEVSVEEPVGEPEDTGLSKPQEDAIDDEVAAMGGEKEEEISERGIALANEEECSECGSFDTYAESKGYNLKEEIPSLNEMAYLMSGYINAHNEGMNDGDVKGISKYMNENVRKELNDYGHGEFTKMIKENSDVKFGKLEPFPVEEYLKKKDLNEEELDEISWGGLKRAGEYVGKGVKSKAQKAGQWAKQKAQQAGQAVSSAAQRIAQAVQGQIDNVTGDIKRIGDNIYRQYQAGAKDALLDDLVQMAASLGELIGKINDRAVKAGEEPINVQSILSTIANKVAAGKDVDLNKYRSKPREEPAPTPDPAMRKSVSAGGGIERGGISGARDAGIRGGYFRSAMKEAEEMLVKAYIYKKLEEHAGLRKATLTEGRKELAIDRLISENWNKTGKKEYEQAKLVRSYVRKQLDEKVNGKKTNLNESKKSESLKKIDQLIESELNQVKEDMSGQINELDPATVRSASQKMFDRGQERRAERLASTGKEIERQNYARSAAERSEKILAPIQQFIGRPLGNGTIVDFNYSDDFSRNLDIITDDPNFGGKGTITYTFDKDTFFKNPDWEFTRKDARTLGSIIKTVNPETQYAQGTGDLKIIGY